MVPKEPQVGLNKNVVFLRPDSPEADVDIRNIGDGALTWMAFNSEPTIAGAVFWIRRRGGSPDHQSQKSVNFDEVSSYFIEIPLGIINLKGSTKDIADLIVVITDQAYSSVVHVSPDGFCAGLVPCFSSIQGAAVTAERVVIR